MADEAPKPGEHPVLAGVEGAIRGLVPFGGGDAFMRGMLGETPEERETIRQGQLQRKQVNPGAAITGEVGGTLAGLLIPGSQAKLVGGIEDAAAKAVGGGFAGKSLSSMAGGSLYGLGRVINEDTLGEPSTAAEKLAIIAEGGLVGGALSAITHGVSKAAEGALAKTAGSSSMRELLHTLADRTAELGLSSKKVTRANALTGPESRSIFREYADLFAPGDTHSSFLEKVTAAKEAAGQEMGGALQPGWFNPDRLEVRVEKNILDNLRKNPHAEGDVKRIEGLLQGYKERALTLEDIHKIQSEIKSSVGYAEAATSKKVLSDFRTELRDELIDQLHEAVPGAGRQYTDAANKYRQLSALEGMAEEKVLQHESNSPIALRDMMAMMFGLSHGNLAAVGLGLGSKVARERGAYFTTSMLRRLADGQFTPAVAGAFKGKIDSLLDSGLGGVFRNTLAELSAQGAEHLLGGHVLLAQSDPNYLPALGLEHETPEASSQYAAKEAGLGTIRQHLSGLDDAMNLEADRFAGKAQGRPPKLDVGSKMSGKEFADIYSQLQHIAAAPAVVDTSKMAGVSPTVAALLQQQVVKNAQFLLDKAPKDPNTGKLPALARPWKPSESDLATWSKYVEGVTQPMKAVAQVNAGRLPTPEAVEALRTVYPKTFEDLRSKMMDRVSSLKDPMSYGKKQALASLFGREILGDDPRVGQLIQASHKVATVPPSGNMPKTDGRQTVSQAENMATQAQRIQTRGAR